MSYKDMKEKALQDKSSEDITPKYLEWKKEGQAVLGKFIARAEVKSSIGEGTYFQYLFDTDNGLVKFALGSATDKEFNTLLRAGNVYEITYKGQEKLKGARVVNKFSLILIARTSSMSPEDLEDVPF